MVCGKSHTRRFAMTAPRMVCPCGQDFDFTDPDVLVNGMPVAEFAELRKTAPVWWNEQPAGATVFDDGGYWVISRHEDIKAISRNNEVWSTNALLINHDAPAHTRLRKLISRLFTPRSVAALEEKLAAAAHGIVRSAADKQNGNFVDDVAMSLPLQAIADLLGVPEADRERLFHWTNSIMNTDDPDFDDDPMAANAELMA